MRRKRVNVAASAANPKFASGKRQTRCELRVQSGTRIIVLLVSFRFRSSYSCVPSADELRNRDTRCAVCLQAREDRIWFSGRASTHSAGVRRHRSEAFSASFRKMSLCRHGADSVTDSPVARGESVAWCSPPPERIRLRARRIYRSCKSNNSRFRCPRTGSGGRCDERCPSS
jgi:hypothetical protein